MFNNYNSPGSVLWRLKNYGLFASIFHALQKNVIRPINSNSLQSITFMDLLRLLEIVDHIKVSKDLSEIISKKLALFQEHDSEIKIKDVISTTSFSDTRLKVLGACIIGICPDTIIETGTQHGVSASIISKVISTYGLNSIFVTFDLKQNYLLDTSIEKHRFILPTPVRSEFKKATLQFSKGKVLFFHDSDHSYENMEFEFKWAWEKLNADVLIADDIDNNQAFVNFCNKLDITGYRLKFDKGPAVGLALRSK
jgi:hypothetical protein